MILFSILFWLLLSVGLLALTAFVLGRFFTVERTPDAIVFCETGDGWRVALQHHAPRAPIPGAPPVLLVPGFASGSAVFAFDPDAALAPYLARYGHDLWLLDGRGSAPADAPRLFGRRRASWSFDDRVEFDLPAALETVCRETGAHEVQVIGLGSGALALAATAAGPAARRVRSLALLGATAFFRRQAASLPLWPLRLLRLLPVAGLTRLVAPLLGRVYPGPLALLCNRDNVEPASFRRALVNAARAPAPRELAQLASFLREDRFQAEGGTRDYRALLAEVQAPTLLLHGPRDPFAPADAIEATANALSAVSDKVTVLASRMSGMSANYGHLDLLLGQNAQRDVFPHLLKWLDLHAGVLIEEDGRPEPSVGEAEPRRRGAEAPAVAASTPPATAAAPAAVAPTPAPAPAPTPESAPPAPATDAPLDPVRALAEESDGDEDDDEPSWLTGDVPRLPPSR
jgi:pimeloyl-ACP methyl ester carboxylesterase